MENLIERILILNEDGLITINDLPQRFHEYSGLPPQQPMTSEREPERPVQELSLPEQGINLNSLVEGVEKNLISQAMKRAQGVKSKAADLLGLKRTTLLEKIKKFELDL
jgi:DNA-binding NtrC family response regulator